MGQEVFERSDLKEEVNRLLGMARATINCRFTSRYVGGQPAERPGVEAFVTHHLKLAGDEAAKAVERILGEEVRIIEPDADKEVEEKTTYGLNVIRRTEKGAAYIGTWQIRAMVKQSASRLRLLSKKVGSKGDLSEAMLVYPHGASAIAGEQQVVIIGPDNQPYTERVYEKFMGSVQNAKGRASIVHDSEIAPPGCTFSVVVEWPLFTQKVTPSDMAAIWGLGERIGLGSVRGQERGRFEVLGMEVETPEKHKD